jgi:hypothetical protein
VIGVIVARDERVDLRDAGLLHHLSDAVSLPVVARIDQQRLAVGHDDEVRVGLLHVDVVDAQRLGGRERSGAEEQRGRKDGLSHEFPLESLYGKRTSGDGANSLSVME